MDQEIAKVIIPALIGAGAAILVFIIKDVFLYELREKRDLLDRRLSQLYAPIFVALKGGTGMLGNIFLSDENIFDKFTANMHLLSPALYDIAQEYLQLGKDVRAETLPLNEQKRAIELSKKFNEIFLEEFKNLREEYQGGFWNFKTVWKRLTNRST